VNDSIRQDVESEIQAFVARLRDTLDPAAYPQLADAARFEVRLEVLGVEFMRLTRLFQDYLAVSWAEEFKRSASETGPASAL
jgi:hypothetical protein